MTARAWSRRYVHANVHVQADVGQWRHKAYNVSWEGNDGTFSSAAATISLPLNANAEVVSSRRRSAPIRPSSTWTTRAARASSTRR